MASLIIRLERDEIQPIVVAPKLLAMLMSASHIILAKFDCDATNGIGLINLSGILRDIFGNEMAI
ncbi:MAG: hypothetical protein HOO95_07135 [Gallionella sp.]|nr:hypothetical protein [Gallionella sp.]